MVTSECSKMITDLGYYGVPITEKNIKSFLAGKEYRQPAYAIRTHSSDGSSEVEYNSMSELTDAAQGWKGSSVCGQYTVRCEGTTVELIGASWSDVGFRVVDGELCA